MGNFCSQCGLQLEEGQVCECSQPEVSSDSKTSTNDFKRILGDMAKFALDLFKQPSDTMRNVAKNSDYKMGLMFVAVQAVVSVLVMLVVANFLRNSLGILGYFLGISNTAIFSTLIQLIISTFFQYFLFCGVIYLAFKVTNKNSSSFKVLMSIVGVSTVPLSLALIISLILTVVFWPLALIVISVGFIISIFINFFGLREAANAPEDKVMYILAASYVIYFSAFTILSTNSGIF